MRTIRRFHDAEEPSTSGAERRRRAAVSCVALLISSVALIQPVRCDEPGWAGLGPDGGEVLSLAVSPHLDHAVYVGTGSGVFVSRDDGASWRLAGLAGERVLALAVDPTTPGLVWAGVDSSDVQGSGGAFLSTDGGGTWTPARQGLEDPWYPPDSPHFHYEPVHSLLVDPHDGSTVWAGTYRGLLRSDDGGATWVQAAFDRTVSVLAASPAALLAGVRDSYRFYRSADGGATWLRLGADLARASGLGSVGRVVGVAAAVQGPEVIYVVTDEEIFRSDDGGEGWQSLGSLPTTVDYNGHATLVAVAVDPQDSATVVVATRFEGVFTSRDGGASWLTAGDGLECGPDSWGVGHLRASSVAVAPGTGVVVLGTERHGIYLRSGHDDPWRASSRGLHAVGVSALAADPDRPWRLLAATRGVGLFASANSGVEWSADNDGVDDPCGPPDFVAWAFPVPDCRVMNDAVWIGGESDALVAGECGIHTRAPGSSSWSLEASPGIWSTSVIALSSRELWAVRWHSEIVHSRDGGATWSEVSELPSRLSPTSLAVASQGGTLAAGSPRGLWLSRDSGTTWEGPVTEINATCPDAEWTSVPAMVFTHEQPQRLLVGTTCGVFVGAPDGTGWQRAGLDGHRVTAFAFFRHRVFAGTRDAGVWVSEDGLATWQPLTGPAGLVSVTSLTVDAAGRRLYVSTAANGVFALELPRPSPRRGRARAGGAPPGGGERARVTP